MFHSVTFGATVKFYICILPLPPLLPSKPQYMSSVHASADSSSEKHGGVKPNTFNHRVQQIPLISFSKTNAASVTCVEILDTDDGEYEAFSSSRFSSSNDMRSGKDPLCCGFGVLIGRFTRS